MKWLTMFFTTSIGRKQLMAITGLGLSGFLVVHLTGNLLLFVEAESAFGVKFNEYAAFLHKQPWLIPSEIGLLVMFFVHVGLAIKLTRESGAARPGGYSKKSASDATLASRSMIYTGVLVFVFLIFHLIAFKFGEKHPEDGLAGLVRDSFQNPAYSLAYVACMVVLGLHLVHGLSSAFQTFGWNHPKYTPLVKKACMLFAILLCAAFASIPLWFLLTQGGQS